MERVEKDQRRRREQAQAVHMALADFRIYWDALGSALLGRELLLIDADAIKGQRNLFLFDADQLRLPLLAPPAMPPNAK